MLVGILVGINNFSRDIGCSVEDARPRGARVRAWPGSCLAGRRKEADGERADEHEGHVDARLRQDLHGGIMIISFIISSMIISSLIMYTIIITIIIIIIMIITIIIIMMM